MKPFTPPALPPSSLDWPRLVPLLGDAHRELAHFDALLRNTPNAWLFLSPLTTREALLSSRIEGTQATLEEVLRFQTEGEAAGGRRDDIQEVINYRLAVDTLFGRLETAPLSGSLLKEAHGILLSGMRGKGKDPGRFRSGMVHIGSPEGGIRQATYIPPEPRLIPQLFANLERYIRGRELDVLVQLAIVHAQFELIHPFWDGNGRVGRLLMPLFLYWKGAISVPCFYISEHLEQHRDEYYGRLRSISKGGHWERWIEFFLQAIAGQSRRDADRAQGIIDLKEKMVLKISEITHSRYSPHIADFIFSNPWFTSVDFQGRAGAPHTSAYRLLTVLESGGIIRKVTRGKGRRPSVYEFPALMTALD